ncbi:MAG: glutathione S-transferase [Myxococcales bacterium]|nr:glutathione S-transferase [Myxococcales bacterium]
MVKLYGFSRVNSMARGNTRDLRILWALDEMKVPHEIVGIDHPAHGLDTDAYRAMNPFGQIPVIDDDGVVVTESGAILLYLARKTGKLNGDGAAEEAQVLRWSIAALSTVELPLLSLWFVDMMGGKEGKTAKPREALHGWSDMRLRQLDGWLADREFIATNDFTVADILLAHVVSGGTDQSLLEPYANLRNYRDRCMARPSWQRVRDSYFARVEGT